MPQTGSTWRERTSKAYGDIAAYLQYKITDQAINDGLDIDRKGVEIERGKPDMLEHDVHVLVTPAHRDAGLVKLLNEMFVSSRELNRLLGEEVFSTFAGGDFTNDRTNPYLIVVQGGDGGPHRVLKLIKEKDRDALALALEGRGRGY